MDNTIEYIKVEDIIPSKIKSREDYSDLEGLTISIQNYGIIQPILVRPNNGKYEIVLGERRYEASLKLGLKQIPAIIKKLNDKEATEYIILDNIQRKNFTENEINSIYKYLKNKFNVDKYYISSNLGMKDNYSINPEENEINSKTQLNLLKDEQFKSILEKKLNNSNINLKRKDVVNLEDLNNKEIEREDNIMNNEILNNNNLGGISNQTTPQNQNTTPTFGGRFFPSLEDEQTNMGLNTEIPSPITNQENTNNLQQNIQSSPMIDLTNLNNTTSENINTLNNNPQLEPTPNILNPVSNNIPNSVSNTPEQQNQELSIKMDNLENNSLNNLGEQPVMPNLDQIKDEQTVQKLSNISPQETPIPNIEVPQPELVSSVAPTLEPTQQISPIEISATSVPNIESQIPNSNSIESQLKINNQQEQIITTPNESAPPTLEPTQEVSVVTAENKLPTVEQPQLLEKKDIIPAVNTIKSIVDTLSQLGYSLNTSENDNGDRYNITIEIVK